MFTEEIYLCGDHLLMYIQIQNLTILPGNATGFGTQSQTPPTRQYGISLTAKF